MPVPGLPAQHQPLTQPGQQEIRVTASWPEQLSSHRIQAVSEPNPKQEESASHTCQLGPQPTGGHQKTPPCPQWAHCHKDAGREPEDLAEDGHLHQAADREVGTCQGWQQPTWRRLKNRQISPTRNSQCSRFCPDVTEWTCKNARLLRKPEAKGNVREWGSKDCHTWSTSRIRELRFKRRTKCLIINNNFIFKKAPELWLCSETLRKELIKAYLSKSLHWMTHKIPPKLHFHHITCHRHNMTRLFFMLRVTAGESKTINNTDWLRAAGAWNRRRCIQLYISLVVSVKR